MLEASKPSFTISTEHASTLRIAIVRSTFNSELTESLQRGCITTLDNAGVHSIDTFLVPGALEIPVTAQAIARTGKYNAIVALGLIMKGDTYHFELVADECARGCMDVSLQYGVPVLNEVLACYTKEQAVLRASNDELNKGIEAANAALHICATLASIGKK